MVRNAQAFTLIELLVVVLIVAILSVVALFNMLEAQTRAKVSRAKADLRTIATGLEAYAADWNQYPLNDGVYNVIPIEVSTPIAYLTHSQLVDPFSDRELHPTYGELARFYTYTKVVSLQEGIRDMIVRRNPPNEGIDHRDFNLGALAKYGRWRLVSNGPDRRYSDQRLVVQDPVLWGADTAYDPSNGTVSFGNILRTQRETDMRVSQ